MAPRFQLLSWSTAIPHRFLRASQSAHRTFTSSTSLSSITVKIWRRGGDTGAHLPKHVIPKNPDVIIPDYPYGPSRLFKQSNKGLYGGSRIQFGNNVSRKSETKTRRHWKPNVLSKSLYSVTLDKKIKLRVTARVLKTIDREGGLDAYLLKESESRVKELGPLGWSLRCVLLQKPLVIQQMRAKAQALGLPQEEIEKRWPSLDDIEWGLELRARRGELAAEAEEYLAAGDANILEEGLKLVDKRRRQSEIEAKAAAYVRLGEANSLEEGLQLAKVEVVKDEVERLKSEKTKLEKNARRTARSYVRLGLVGNQNEGMKLVKERADKLRERKREQLEQALQLIQLDELKDAEELEAGDSYI